MKLFSRLILLSAAMPALALAQPTQLGLVPIPTLTGVGVQTGVSYDSTLGNYTYSYTLTNPSSNTGYIATILLDMKAPTNYDSGSAGVGLTLPRGGAGMVSFDDLLHDLTPPSLPINYTTLAFGITAPPDWIGTLTVNGTGGFAAVGDAQSVAPGQTMGGFNLISQGVPTIKSMYVIPYWVFDVGENNEPTEAEDEQAYQVEQSLVLTVKAVGPSWVPPGTFGHWDQLQADVATAGQLGWIPDAAFAQNVQNQLQAARADFQAGYADYATVTAIKNLLATVTSASPGQLSPDGYNLLYFNLNAMLAVYGNPQPPQPPPPSPKVTITSPASRIAGYPVGTSVTITANVIDQANNDAPLANYNVPFLIPSGPDQGQSFKAVTDANGNASFTFVGKAVGTDSVTINALGFGPSTSFAPRIIFRNPVLDSASIIWSGGPDLIIKEFTPPIITWDGQSQIYITDVTRNIGNTSVGSSDTRYYVSTTTPVDPATAIVVGDRTVPALAPNEESASAAEYAIPSSVGGAGNIYLTACANADRAVFESNYANNCEIREFVAAAKRNILPPDCSKAVPTVTSLWPPNHKMVDIGIAGVTDPANLALTTSITGIQQDEPVDAQGSGNTGPDGAGVGTATAQVRAERSGTGTGRIYFIAFTATNTANLSCNATVQVYVPHDKGQGTVPVDTGQRYDSTQP